MMPLFSETVIGIVSDLGLQREYPLKIPLSLLLADAAFVALYWNTPPDYSRADEGMLFTQLLIIVAYIDAKTQEIPNWTLVLIFICGLAFLRNISDSAIGFLIISVPFLIFSIITHEGIGFGDVKLMAACGFVLGSTRIFLAATVGIALSAIVQLLRLMILRKDRNTRYALAPHLAVGCFFAYLIPLKGG